MKNYVENTISTFFVNEITIFSLRKGEFETPQSILKVPNSQVFGILAK